MKKTRKFISIFAILFALVFALSICFFAACGNKDDDEKDNGTTTNHEHNYVVDNTTWAFSEDYSECTATAKCTATEGTCDAETITVNADVTPNPVSATCTTAGTVTYVAKYGDETVKTSEAVTTDAALGHDVTATWNETDSDWEYTCSRDDAVAKGDTFASTKYMAGSSTALASALENNGTVELTANIVGMFTVSANTTVTLDLAGYSITDKEVVTTADTEETQYTVTVEAGTSLTITDSSDNESGSIVCTYAATDNQNSRLGAAVYTCGTLDIVGGTIKSSSVGILAEGGTTTITGGTISTEYYTIFEAHGTVVVNVGGDAVVTGTRGIYVGGDAYYGYGSSSDSNSWDNDADCTINVYGNAEISTTFGSAISTLGYTGMNTAKINISGGTISGRPVEYDETTEKTTVMPAIYLPNGILNISGGTIEGTTAVEVRGGTANITGGTIKTTAGTTNTPAWNGSGATSYGYAIAVYSYNTVNRPDTGTDIDNTLNVTVSGGTIYGPLCETWKEGATVPEYTFAITGGTFSEDVESEYLDVTQYHTELQSDGTYKVASGVAGRNVEGMITADAYVASQTGMGDGTTLDDTEKTLMSDNNGTSVSFYGDASSGAKISRKNRTSTDGYLFTFAIQIKEASVGSGSLSNCVKVTVTGACTVTVYVMSSNSGGERVLGTWTESDGSYTQDTTTYAVGADANANFNPIKISFAAAGTYLIGATDNNINFYGLTINYTVA